MKAHMKMHRAPYEYGMEVQNLADGHGDAPKYYYVPELQDRYTTGYSDDFSSDTVYRRPTVLAPRYYKPIRSRRRPSKLCLPIVSRPVPRRRYSALPNIAALSDDLNTFLNLYDDDARDYAWPQDYQVASAKAVYGQSAPRLARTTRRRVPAVPVSTTVPRLSRKHARKSEVPVTSRRPIILHVTGQGLRRPNPAPKPQKVMSTKASRSNPFDYAHLVKPSRETAIDSSELYESEDSQLAMPKTTSNSSVIPKTPRVPSRMLKHSKHSSRRHWKPAFAGPCLPKPRRSVREAKQTKKVSYVNNTDSEIMEDLLRDLQKRGITQEHFLEEERVEHNETQVTDSEAGDTVSLVNATAIQSLSTVQEGREAAPSECTGFVELDASEAINAVDRSSHTNMDSELCMKLTRTLTDKLVMAKTSGFIMLPAEEPEYIKTLKQLQKDHLEHIHRETKRLLQIHKYVEEHQNVYTTRSSPKQ